MEKNLFVEITQDELLQLDGGGAFEDIGFAVGYAIRGAVEGVKTIAHVAKEAVNPKNYINYYYPGLLPK
ncbi:MAG: hypothetical protein NAG76_04720 [Candidatus Pristimantibacillus lignocellulolyticus]|uniref:Bacteriocin n=1 Tax=Candidatus Pristimantibacillus lignocellulolyticus TaxID=2994561 RepID=A0A9J6ZHN3_9BACL|nr:MAG: hypothetical protein NAG76_04720 [Candidatus Pristimantibacillus lignocellulolyticus]